MTKMTIETRYDATVTGQNHVVAVHGGEVFTVLCDNVGADALMSASDFAPTCHDCHHAAKVFTQSAACFASVDAVIDAIEGR